MEENNVKPANEGSILSEKIEMTLKPTTSEISESNVELTMSENDNTIKGKVFYFIFFPCAFKEIHLLKCWVDF